LFALRRQLIQLISGEFLIIDDDGPDLGRPMGQLAQRACRQRAIGAERRASERQADHGCVSAGFQHITDSIISKLTDEENP
jgi:hypothetical protein